MLAFEESGEVDAGEAKFSDASVEFGERVFVSAFDLFRRRGGRGKVDEAFAEEFTSVGSDLESIIKSSWESKALLGLKAAPPCFSKGKPCPLNMFALYFGSASPSEV